jgi:hypothetical protein
MAGTAQIDRLQAQTAFARVLLDKVQRDTYPSSTQLGMLEETLPPSMYGDYLGALLAKVADERWPSVSMLARIQRFSERI